ncbi:hypothetical protein D3C81_535640 [compost metagenome]
MVAQIDEFRHPSREAVDARLAGTIEAHALRANRQGDGFAGLADIHRQRFNFFTTSQFDHAAVAGLAVQTAIETVVFADEVGDEGIFRLFVERARRRDLLDFALMEHRHTVGHGQGFALVVGHVDHGHAQALVQVFDFHLHVFTQLFVECAERFVHQHQLRLEHQRAGQCHTLLLTAGQLRRVTLGEGVELDHAQDFFDPVADVAFVQTAHGQRERQVLGDRHVREQRVILEHHADVTLVRRHVVDGAPGQQDFTRSRCFETGEHHQAGGLAGAGRPEQGEEFAFANVQVEVFDDQVLAVVALLHSTKADQNIIGPCA